MSHSQNCWAGEQGSLEPTVRLLPKVGQDLEELTPLRMLIEASKPGGKGSVSQRYIGVWSQSGQALANGWSKTTRIGDSVSVRANRSAVW